MKNFSRDKITVCFFITTYLTFDQYYVFYSKNIISLNYIKEVTLNISAQYYSVTELKQKYKSEILYL